MLTLIEQPANPVDYCAEEVAMHDDPIFRGDLGYRRGYPFKQSVGVTNKTRQYATAGACANGSELHRHVRGTQRDRTAGLTQSLLYPAGCRVMCLLLGVGHPCGALRSALAIDRAGEHTGLGDVEVTV